MNSRDEGLKKVAIRKRPPQSCPWQMMRTWVSTNCNIGSLVLNKEIMIYTCIYIYILIGGIPTPLKISQIGSSSQLLGEKNVPNHQPVILVVSITQAKTTGVPMRIAMSNDVPSHASFGIIQIRFGGTWAQISPAFLPGDKYYI